MSALPRRLRMAQKPEPIPRKTTRSRPARHNLAATFEGSYQPTIPPNGWRQVMAGDTVLPKFVGTSICLFFVRPEKHAGALQTIASSKNSAEVERHVTTFLRHSSTTRDFYRGLHHHAIFQSECFCRYRQRSAPTHSKPSLFAQTTQTEANSHQPKP